MPSSNGEMVQLGGFEPPTSGSTDRRSNHLSYSCTELGRSYWLTPGERLETRSKPRTWQGRYNLGATNWALQNWAPPIAARHKRAQANRTRAHIPKRRSCQTKVLLA